MKAVKLAVSQKIVGEEVRRERRWTSAGATPARELLRLLRRTAAN